MFEELLGLPAHPLLVHAVVVLVPLLTGVALLYAFVPVARKHTRWVAGALAVAAPIAAVFTKLAGDALFDVMDAAEAITEGFYPVLEEHQMLGTNTMWASIALGVATLAMVYAVGPRDGVLFGTGPGAGATGTSGFLRLGLRILVVAAAAASMYYVFRAGDSGARAVWEANWENWTE